jgi:hypothetical protein
MSFYELYKPGQSLYIKITAKENIERATAAVTL